MDAGSGGGLGPSMIAPTNFNPSSHAIIRPLQTADPLQADKERLTEPQQRARGLLPLATLVKAMTISSCENRKGRDPSRTLSD